MKPEFFREDWARLCYPKTAIFEPRPFDTSWAASIRQAMRWARDERRLSQACQAVLEFMQRHPIATTCGQYSIGANNPDTYEMICKADRLGASQGTCRFIHAANC